MPANKKHTNKTAHVLNVITAGRESGEEAPAAEATPVAPSVPAAPAASTAQPAPPPPPVVVPLPTVVEVERAPQELSDRIREALREEVEGGGEDSFSPLRPEVIRTKAPPAPAEDPPPAAPPIVPPAAVPPTAPTNATAQPSPPACQAAPAAGMARPPEAPSPPKNIPAREEREESLYVNVMQALVREKAPKYIKLLGVCPCSRCAADVEALALSRLDPKYIVLQKSQKFPYSVYENHYNAAVTSQIISACRVVMEHPRH